MQSDQLRPAHWKRLYARRIWLCYCIGLLSAACGVREYPHNVPLHDSASDFVPSGGAQHASLDSGQQGSDAAEPGSVTTVDASQTSDGGSAADSGTVAYRRDAGAAADGGKPDAGKPDAGKTTTPPATGDIELGGAQLRKQDVLAFLHFGHSNMAGYATNPPELRPYTFTDTHPHAWMYRVGKPPELALEPTAREDRGQSAGPGVALLKQAAARAPDKYFMSLGFGVGGVYCSQFLPGGPYYDSIIKSAVAIKDRVTFVGIVVMLGSTERNGNDALSGFPDCVNKLVTAAREAIGQPDLPVLMSDYEMGATGVYDPKGEFGVKIIPQVAKLPSVVSNSALVPTDGVAMQDDHHFNLQGHILWTQRLLDIMKAKGWAPWMVK